MPINQERMLALINAAMDYRHGLEDLCKFIQQQAQDHITGHCTAEQAIFEIERRAATRLALEHPEESSSTITLEYYHYRQHKSRNLRVRNKMAERRRAAGIMPRAKNDMPYQTDKLNRFTNPDSMIPPSPLIISKRQQIDAEAEEAAEKERKRALQRERELKQNNLAEIDEYTQQEMDGGTDEDLGFGK